MAIPRFVPIIAGGADPFGGIASQELAWAGFNQRQEQENQQRLAMAEQASNNWFANVADMQARENERRDRLDQSQQESDRRNEWLGFDAANQKASRAEQKRQFDLKQKLDERSLTYQENLAKLNREREDGAVADFAEHYQPLFNESGVKFEAAQERYNKAIEAQTRRISDAEKSKNWPSGRVVFSKTTNQFQAGIDPLLRKSYDLSAEERAAVQSANDSLAAINADYFQAAKEVEFYGKDWQERNREVAKWNLMPVKVDGTWMLRIPSQKKTFGQMVKKAKEDAGETSPFVPQYQPEDSAEPPAEATPPARSEFPVMGASPFPGSWSPRVERRPEPVTKVWRRGPDGRLVLVQ